MAYLTAGIAGLGALGSIIFGLLLLRQRALTQEAKANTKAEKASGRVKQQTIDNLQAQKAELLRRSEQIEANHKAKLDGLNRVLEQKRELLEKLREELATCESDEEFKERWKNELASGV